MLLNVDEAQLCRKARRGTEWDVSCYARGLDRLRSTNSAATASQASTPDQSAVARR
jgi:hypothetical protein